MSIKRMSVAEFERRVTAVFAEKSGRSTMDVPSLSDQDLAELEAIFAYAHEVCMVARHVRAMRANRSTPDRLQALPEGYVMPADQYGASALSAVKGAGNA